MNSGSNGRGSRMAIRFMVVAFILIATAGLATGNPSPPLEDEFADLQRQIVANREWNRDRLERGGAAKPG